MIRQQNVPLKKHMFMVCSNITSYQTGILCLYFFDKISNKQLVYVIKIIEKTVCSNKPLSTDMPLGI